MIGLYKTDAHYPLSNEYFCPSIRYPEYRFTAIATQYNNVYDSIRNLLYLMGYDKQNFNTPLWNPLGTLITPGDTVLLKPNMVLHENGKSESGLQCLITHPSLVRAMVDYVLIALRGTGEIIIADAPLQNCDFELLKMRSGYNKLLEFYNAQNIKIIFKDLRNYVSKKKGILYIESEINNNENIAVQLNEYSMFCKYDDKLFKNFRITNYSPEIMYEHHNIQKNEYLIAKDVLKADVIINMPKPKTHRKAGVTIALKNLIGINTNKEWLPHHTKGSSEESGDEYKNKNIFKTVKSNLLDERNRAVAQGKIIKANCCEFLGVFFSVLSLLYGKYKKNDTYSEGSWYGNDTIWKTILDLNRIIRYVDKQGNIQKKQQRKILNIADMVIAGEGEGPLLPSPIDFGCIAASENAVAMDAALATLMGFDYKKIPSINEALIQTDDFPLYTPGEIDCVSNYKKWNDVTLNKLKDTKYMHLKPTAGWKGHIEL